MATCSPLSAGSKKRPERCIPDRRQTYTVTHNHITGDVRIYRYHAVAVEMTSTTNMLYGAGTCCECHYTARRWLLLEWRCMNTISRNCYMSFLTPQLSGIILTFRYCFNRIFLNHSSECHDVMAVIKAYGKQMHQAIQLFCEGCY